MRFAALPVTPRAKGVGFGLPGYSEELGSCYPYRAPKRRFKWSQPLQFPAACLGAGLCLKFTQRIRGLFTLVAGIILTATSASAQT
jgi:hypothetical protein